MSAWLERILALALLAWPMPGLVHDAASTGQRSRCHTGQHLEGRFRCIPYTLDGSADGGSCVG